MFSLLLGMYLSVELQGEMVTLYNNTVFQSCFTILHSHWQCMKVVFSTFLPIPLLSTIFILTILMGLKWFKYHLICRFLKTNDLSIFSSAHCHLSSLERCPFRVGNSFEALEHLLKLPSPTVGRTI
jgi:hypothetical protein